MPVLCHATTRAKSRQRLALRSRLAACSRAWPQAVAVLGVGWGVFAGPTLTPVEVELALNPPTKEIEVCAALLERQPSPARPSLVHSRRLLLAPDSPAPCVLAGTCACLDG